MHWKQFDVALSLGIFFINILANLQVEHSQQQSEFRVIITLSSALSQVFINHCYQSSTYTIKRNHQRPLRTLELACFWLVIYYTTTCKLHISKKCGISPFPITKLGGSKKMKNTLKVRTVLTSKCIRACAPDSIRVLHIFLTNAQLYLTAGRACCDLQLMCTFRHKLAAA